MMVFAWSSYEKPPTISVRNVDANVEIRAETLPNTSLECRRYVSHDL
jgi:hypothetical protein